MSVGQVFADFGLAVLMVLVVAAWWSVWEAVRRYRYERREAFWTEQRIVQLRDRVTLSCPDHGPVAYISFVHASHRWPTWVMVEGPCVACGRDVGDFVPLERAAVDAGL